MTKFIKKLKHLSERDALNKFIYKNKNNMLEIKSVHLNFGSKEQDLKEAAKLNLAIEIISGGNSKMRVSKSAIVGNGKKKLPAGSTTLIEGSKMEFFLYNLTKEVLPKIKESKKKFPQNEMKHHTFTILSEELNCFDEIEQNSLLLKNLPSLNIVLSFNVSANVSQRKLLLIDFEKFYLK